MAILTPVVGSNVDVKVKVSSNDTTAGYAAEKFFAGSGMTLVQTNDGSNEGLYVHYTGASTSGLSDIVDDVTPQLGGNLDGQNYAITGIGYLQASGHIGGYASKSANYNLTKYDYFVQFITGGATGTLPNPSTVGAGTEFIIKSNTTGIVTVNSSSGMIDNYSTVSLAQYDTLKVVSTGSDYLVI